MLYFLVSVSNLWMATVYVAATHVTSRPELVSRLEDPIRYSVGWGLDPVLQTVAFLLSPAASHSSISSRTQNLLPCIPILTASQNDSTLAPIDDCGV